MRKGYTHIAVILDRTGSMESIRDDTIGGFNAFLAQQKQEPGQATLTLVQFDTQDPYEVIHRCVPLADVPPLTRETFVPRASTPLLDAMGRGINDLEKSLADMPEDARPERIVLVIVTDGRENSSREFRKDQIAKMVREKQERDAWQFVFLSADMGAIHDAMDLGVRGVAAMAFVGTAEGTASAWASVSASCADYRSARRADASFTDADRDAQEAARKKHGRRRPSEQA
ncbi:MAG: VWA domain-containing protein [Lentisphaeria bacterium]|nr:VWA domain-containing protein [Lentisphaeria bacterium]